MEPKQLRDYSQTDPLTEGSERGKLLLDRLGELAIDLGAVILDVGCGYGGLSFAFAQTGKTVYAIDKDSANIEVVRGRVLAGEASPGQVVPLQCSALKIPLEGDIADTALMIGVIEWIGFTSYEKPVQALQVDALKEVFRVLRPGGYLIVGTKNRLFPRYLWRDAQLNKPLVNVLPRRWADFVSTRLWGYRYRGFVYSYWGWRRLLSDAGFELPQVYVPLFTYQYPRVLLGPWQSVCLDKEMMKSTSQLSTAALQASEASRMPAIRKNYYRLLALLGLLGLGAGSFLLVSRKPLS